MGRVRNLVLPASAVRRGFNHLQQKTLNAVYPGTGQHVTRSDFGQYSEGKVLYFNTGFIDLTTDNTTIGNAVAGA